MGMTDTIGAEEKSSLYFISGYVSHKELIDEANENNPLEKSRS